MLDFKQETHTSVVNLHVVVAFLRSGKKGMNLSQYNYRGRGSSSSKSSSRGKPATKGGASGGPSRGRVGNTLGFMPVPQPRSFLSGGGYLG